jgi:tRNA-specific adenosine deaminase 3
VQSDYVKGSLFNHSHTPNVSFSLDPSTESIRYYTTRQVLPDEELSIFYGHELWFDDINVGKPSALQTEDMDDGWGGLGSVGDWHDLGDDFNIHELVQEDHLPFKRVRITPDEEEEEDMDSVRRSEPLDYNAHYYLTNHCLVDAWAVDILDSRHTTTMLKCVF